MDKRQQIIIFAAIIVVGTVAALLFFYGQNEHNARASKEKELTTRLAELSQKDAEILNLIKQKKDLEEQFTSKTAEMGNTLKKYLDTINSLHEESDKAARQKEALMDANTSYENQIAELKKQIKGFESEQKNLLGSIEKLKQDLSETHASEEKVHGAGSNRRDLTVDPATGAVDLGKIVMRKSSGSAAHVQSIDDLYHFIIINAGVRDGLKKGTVLNVLREDHFIARVIVQKVSQNSSAALIVPEWTKENIQIDDTVSHS